MLQSGVWQPSIARQMKYVLHIYIYKKLIGHPGALTSQPQADGMVNALHSGMHPEANQSIDP